MYNLKEKLQSLSSAIQQLSQKELQKYLIMTLGTVTLLLSGIIYYTHSTSTDLALNIKRTEKLANKSIRLMEQYEKLQEEENRLKDLLAKHKDFNVKIYFEQFCKQHGITPEPGWNTSVDIINEKFEEVTLPATFKNQTTEKLVQILEKFDKNELIYVKTLSIRSDKQKKDKAQQVGKKVSFDVTIATKRMS